MVDNPKWEETQLKIIKAREKLLKKEEINEGKRENNNKAKQEKAKETKWKNEKNLSHKKENKHKKKIHWLNWIITFIKADIKIKIIK